MERKSKKEIINQSEHVMKRVNFSDNNIRH